MLAGVAITLAVGIRLGLRALRAAARLLLLAIPRDAPRPGENDVRAVYEILPCGRRLRVEPPGRTPPLLLWVSQLWRIGQLAPDRVAERCREAQRRARLLPESLYLVRFENPGAARDGSRLLVVTRPAAMDEGGRVARAGTVGGRNVTPRVRGIAFHRDVTDADMRRVTGMGMGAGVSGEHDRVQIFLRVSRMRPTSQRRERSPDDRQSHDR